VILYHLLKLGSQYADVGPDFFDRLAPERLTRYYVKRLGSYSSCGSPLKLHERAIQPAVAWGDASATVAGEDGRSPPLCRFNIFGASKPVCSIFFPHCGCAA
jgi:hypothetical protein